MLVMAPIQMSWAAVAAYCLHETEASGDAHFGHHAHAHVHDEAVAADAAEGETGPANVDHDCGHCHAAHSVLLSESTASGLSPGMLTVPAFEAQRPLPVRSPRPERPQWPGLA